MRYILRKYLPGLLIVFVVLVACSSTSNLVSQMPPAPDDLYREDPTSTSTPNETPIATPTPIPEIDLEEFFFPYKVPEVIALWDDLGVPQKDRYFTYHLVNRINREIPYEDRCGYHPGDLIIPLGSTQVYEGFNIDAMMPYSGRLTKMWITEGGDDGFTFYLGRNNGEETYLNIYHTNVSDLSVNQYLNQGDIFGTLTYTNNFGGWNETKIHLTLFHPANDGGTDFLGDEVDIIDITSVALPATMQSTYQYDLNLLLTYQGDNWCNMTPVQKINILLEKYLPDAGYCVNGNIVTYCGAREEYAGLEFTQYKWEYDDRSIMLVPLNK